MNTLDALSKRSLGCADGKGEAGGGGPLFARVSLVLSHPPFTFVGDFSTTSSNASSCSLSVKPQNFPALLEVPARV